MCLILNIYLCAESQGYSLICENCGCGGSEGIDWMQLNHARNSVDQCFEAANSNTFCGTMIIIDDIVCYCMKMGKEESCTKEQFPNPPIIGGSKVYRKIGKPECYANNEKPCRIIFIL